MSTLTYQDGRRRGASDRAIGIPESAAPSDPGPYRLGWLAGWSMENARLRNLSAGIEQAAAALQANAAGPRYTVGFGAYGKSTLLRDGKLIPLPERTAILQRAADLLNQHREE